MPNEHLSTKAKENVTCVSMKSFKEENLLNERSELSNKCRNQNKFTLMFSLKHFPKYPHRPPFGPPRLMFFIILFSKLKSNSSK